MDFKINIGNICPESQAMAKSFLCVNCKYLKFNQYLLECGHYLCDDCQKKIKVCPEHNIKIISQSLFKAKVMDEILKTKLICFCIYRKLGCQWTGYLKELCEKHINLCPFKKEEIIKIDNEILGKKYLKEKTEVIDLNIIELSDDENKKNKKNLKYKRKHRKNSDSDYLEEVINLNDTPPTIINLTDD